MADAKRFLPSEAKDVLPADSQGDFLLPICLPKPDLLMGEALAVIVLETVEGQRVGVPMGVEALSKLHGLLGEALRVMSAPEGGTVQ